MIPQLVNGQWRLVYDGRLTWVNRRGLGGIPCNDMVFANEQEAIAFIDKMGE